MRVADEEIFKGARVVRSAGHIAGRGFREGKTLHTICDPRRLLTLDRSIYALTAHHDLARSPCAVLGRLWTYLVLPACRFGCFDADVSGHTTVHKRLASTALLVSQSSGCVAHDSSTRLPLKSGNVVPELGLQLPPRPRHTGSFGFTPSTMYPTVNMRDDRSRFNN